jgi:hypothetical protein
MKMMTLTVAVAAACMMMGAQAAGVRHVAVDRTAVAIPAVVQPENLGAPMSHAERQQLTSQIVQKWSYYVQKVRDEDPSVWSRSMSGAFRTADPGNLRHAATMETYEGMIGVLLGHNTRDDQVIDAFAKLAPASVGGFLLGSPAADLVYNVLTPCRILDTRVTGGTILSGETRNFIAYNVGGDFTAQGGTAASDCGIPAYAAAVVVNITDVLPPQNNFITIWPFGEAKPTTATILGVKNGNVSNETVIKITQGGASHFSAFAFGKADLVGDVVGYFSAPAATALDCVTATSTNPSIAAGADYSLSASCPAGYSVTGGGVNITGSASNASDWIMSESYAKSSTKWQTSGRNNGPDADTIQLKATCCRVPGH